MPGQRTRPNIGHPQVLYLQGFLPVLQIFISKTLLIPGLTINTGVGTFTPENYLEIAPLIEAGLR